MISKKGRGRKAGAGSFRDLADYVTEGARAEFVTVTNFTVAEGDDVQTAIAEVEGIQRLNTTATTDKSYHMIVSFRPEDAITPAMLAEIEQHLCEKLGLSDHQRISALHIDTGNPHLHIAINLVHPETLVKASPFQDYPRLSEGCREMELKHGLARDEGLHVITADGEIERVRKGQEAGEQKRTEAAKLIESHRGIESFQGWVSKEPADVLRAKLKESNCDWQAIHETAARYNLNVVERGNGLAVVDQDNPKLAARASDVGRFFSKSQLESKLGQYEPPKPDQAKPAEQRRYVEEPTQVANQDRKQKQHELYQEYRAERGAQALAKREATEKQRAREKERFGAIADRHRQQRSDIAAGSGSAAEKKAAYKIAAMDRVLSEQAARETFAKERAELRSEYGRSENYRQFVTRRAQDGDEAALSALRGMKPDTSERDRRAGDDTIRSSKPAEPRDVMQTEPLYKGRTLEHRVHRNGDVTYTLNGREALRDEGRVIRVKDSHDADTVELGLRLAQKKYGQQITLTGSEEFKRLAVETAVARGVNVTFVDPQIEAYRRRLVEDKQAATDAARQSERIEHLQASAPAEKIAFAVPYAERAEASDMGLKWDRERKGYAAEKGSQAAELAARRWPVKPRDEEQEKQAAPDLAAAPMPPTGKAPAELPAVPASPPAATETRKVREYATTAEYIAARNEAGRGNDKVLPHRAARDGEAIDGTLRGRQRIAGTGEVVMKIETTDPTTRRKEFVVVPVTKENEKELSKLPLGSKVAGHIEQRELKVRAVTPKRGISR